MVSSRINYLPGGIAYDTLAYITTDEASLITCKFVIVDGSVMRRVTCSQIMGFYTWRAPRCQACAANFQYCSSVGPNKRTTLLALSKQEKLSTLAHLIRIMQCEADFIKFTLLDDRQCAAQ